jgi:hypothetical protein
MSVVRYRKLPVVVDTVQWTGTNLDELTAFTGGLFIPVDPGEGLTGEYTGKVFDALHSTWVLVKTGQHVVRGVLGEFYPIAEDVLAETYEAVVDGFFQPGRTYQRRRWLFQCLAVAPNPFNGETRAVGFLHRPGEPATATALDPDDWAHGGWADATDTTTGDNQ